MTNVPGAGFVFLLAAAATLLALPALAGVSLLVARAVDRHLVWVLLGVHAVAIVVGVLAFGMESAVGFQETPLASAFGFLRFTLGALVAGLLVAAVVEGIPIGLGALLTAIIGDTSWERGLWYAAAGYALGGVGGALVGAILVGGLGAVLGALLSTPAALAGVLLEAASTRIDRPASA